MVLVPHAHLHINHVRKCATRPTASRPAVECAHAVSATPTTGRGMTPRVLQTRTSERYPLPVVARLERPQPDVRLAVGGGVGLAIAKESGEGG